MTVGQRVGDWVRRAGRRLLPAPETPLIATLIRQDPRSAVFFQALEYVNYEQVPGDIVECGVFGGVSLALLAKGATFDAKGMDRRIVGIDSFEGLPESSEAHGRWRRGDCAAAHGGHPLLYPGERVSPEITRELFARCGLEPPVLHVGRFADVFPRIVPGELPSAALIHIDCDLYESARDALDGLAPALQDGTMILFDDWFHYKGHPRRGEARAFAEFLDAHPEWTAVPWHTYATFCRGFIVSRQ